MAEHFGEPYTAAMCDGVCDNCANATNADKPPPKDVTDEAETILGLLEEYAPHRSHVCVCACVSA